MQISETINSTRLFNRILELGEIGRSEEGGVTRRALSAEDKKGHDLVIGWMKEIGMAVRYDHFGNLIGRKEGKQADLSPVVVGSHIDSVRDGGRFDGVIGVLGGLEIAQVLQEEEFDHDRPFEVIAFCEEEGSRFNDGLFGSRGIIGKITALDLNRQDEQSISRYEALRDFSDEIDPEKINESVLGVNDIHAYLEMHIEQGPSLEKEELAVGVVTHIAGPHWMTVTVSGEAGHAGTVPMNLRKDPIPAVAEIILYIENLCTDPLHAETVGTVGIVETYPGGSNIIPEKVTFSLDLRDIDLSRREKLFEEIQLKIEEVSKERGLKWEINEGMRVPPVSCTPRLTKKLQNSMEALGLQPHTMISGAGHDAMLVAEIAEMGMLFVRCRKGISHQREEWADQDDIAQGTKVLLDTVKELLNEK
ncbi:Zn-dependent hydrolase [Planomicrobium sp. YIM 101495]|uniref:Zn-dependent hydrolase n=1 Tax=Planomicrobium sp. YIM 101495 TaxID=2665160 RepID=UPI0012B861BE|nr:Zn-dependent hydrolase [Planomicrobium sp. YIM 101495]MTD30724.1 hydantoinase/carbamoylase family amidase [Planomicrobium sp. YIM 101495]